jgi:hypothetical protein
MTARAITLLAVLAALTVVVFVAGRAVCRRIRARRGARHSAAYDDGYAEGVRATTAQWEKVAGVPFERLQKWRTGRVPFENLAAATEVLPSFGEVMAEAKAQGYAGRGPSVADRVFGPSVAEVDDLAARYAARTGWTPEEYARHNHSETTPCVKLCPAFPHPSPAPRGPYEYHRADEHSPMEHMYGPLPGAPIVADLTGAAAWSWDDDMPTTVTGVVVAPPRPGRAGPEWVDYHIAAQDADTAAYLRRVEADMASFRRGLPAGERM